MGEPQFTKPAGGGEPREGDALAVGFFEVHTFKLETLAGLPIGLGQLGALQERRQTSNALPAGWQSRTAAPQFNGEA